jgi:hypothetical protein
MENDKLFLDDGAPIGFKYLKDFNNLNSFLQEYYPDEWIGHMAQSHDCNDHVT